jgi:hypothetical protein
MLCIFCLEESSPSQEHVFPDAIGGTLTINRVCRRCNDRVNQWADRDVIQHPFVRMRRALLKIPDRRGNVLDPLADILGKGTIVGDECGQEVIVRLDPLTDRPTLKLIYQRAEKEGQGGKKEVEIKIDARDADKLPTILQRERKRARLPELSESDLNRSVSEILARGPIAIENSVVRHQVALNFTEPGRGLLKIAYELAWYWLRDDYLHDEGAKRLRQVILSEKPLDDPKLPQIHGSASAGQVAIPPLELWNRLPDAHIALMSRAGSHVVVAIRVFNALSAIVGISEDSARYPHLAERNYTGNFIKLDPVSRSLAESTLAEAVSALCRDHPPKRPSR